jgi:hypothetical protein
MYIQNNLIVNQASLNSKRVFLVFSGKEIGIAQTRYICTYVTRERRNELQECMLRQFKVLACDYDHFFVRSMLPTFSKANKYGWMYVGTNVP